MDKLLQGLKVYDPSSVKVKLIREDGEELDLYGFAHDLKVLRVRTGILFRLQSLSDVVKVLMNNQGELFTFSIVTSGDFKEYLHQFNGIEGTLELEEAELLCSEVPIVTFRLDTN